MRLLAVLVALLVVTGCSRVIEGTPTGEPAGPTAPTLDAPAVETAPAPPAEPDTPEAAAVALEQMFDAVAIGDFAGACTRIDPAALGWTPETCPAEVAANVADTGYDLSALTVDRARVQAEPDLARIPGSALQVDGVDSPSVNTYEMRRTTGTWLLSAVTG